MHSDDKGCLIILIGFPLPAIYIWAAIQYWEWLKAACDYFDCWEFVGLVLVLLVAGFKYLVLLIVLCMILGLIEMARQYKEKRKPRSKDDPN